MTTTNGAYATVGDRRPLLPTEADFAGMLRAHNTVAPDPGGFHAFLEKAQPLVTEFRGWTDAQLRAITAPTLLVVGDTDFVRLEHAAAVHALLPDSRLAVLPDCVHMQVMQHPVLPSVLRSFFRHPA